MATDKTSDGRNAAGSVSAMTFAYGDARSDVASRLVDVKAIRASSGMTQKAFATAYGFTLGALRDWEQGRKPPERTARVLLRVVAEAPDAVARAASVS